MIEGLFNITVDVLRLVLTDDAYGGCTEVETVLHNNLACRINWKSGQERLVFDKATYLRDGVLFCSAVDVTVKDRINYNGTTYEIVSVSNVDNMNHHLKIEIKLFS